MRAESGQLSSTTGRWGVFGAQLVHLQSKPRARAFPDAVAEGPGGEMLSGSRLDRMDMMPRGCGSIHVAAYAQLE